MFALLLLALVVFSGLLIKATDILLTSLNSLSKSVSVDKFGLTAFLMAFATSFPELFVAITAAVRGDPELSLGNVIGSNIANLSLILGGAALISGAVKAYDEFVNTEVFHTFLAGSLPFLLLLDKSLTRLDGVILLFVYVLYNLTVLRKQRQKIVEKRISGEAIWWKRLWYKLSDKKVEKDAAMLFIGVGLLIFSADMLVRVAEKIAGLMHLPMLLIGMILVAIGTSLPELSFEVAAIKRKETAMALGNILGSVVTNASLILGITAVINPIRLADGLRSYLIATIAFVSVFGLFWWMVRSKRTLDRWEGLVLVLVYVLFAVFEFFKLKNGFSF